MASGWAERYEGGSAEAEALIFRSWIDAMLAEATRHAAADAPAAPLRWMHTKTVAGVVNACLFVDRDLPADLAVAHFQPGAALPVLLRFSNASRLPQADHAPDIRGAALRLALPSGGVHDLLLANCPAAIARDARQFLDLAAIFVRDRGSLLAQLALHVDEAESLRIARLLKGAFKLCSSLAAERYWSGTAFLWGACPVRFALHPVGHFDAAPAVAPDPDSLRSELRARLAAGEVRFRFAVQRFVDARRTPIEDSAVDWSPAAPATEIATLLLPSQRLTDAPDALVDAIVFDPWNAPPEFRPLGSLNRLRRLAYRQSRCNCEAGT